MTSANLNLLIEKGTDFSKGFRVSTSEGLQTLTDWIFAAQVRAIPGSPVIADFDVGLSESDQIVTISLDYQTTQTLAAGRYLWDLFCSMPDGRRFRLLEGQCSIVDRITQY